MEKGRVTHSSFFWLRSLKSEGKSRFSAIVPQKAVKTAVGRNLLRRKMYEAIKIIISDIQPGHEIVVCAKSLAIPASFADLAKEMKILFVKSGLLK
jgi:ribonuclease P protein component